MDLGNKTLTGILRTIAAENVLVGYNTYRNRKGRIIVKISYEEPLSSDHKEDSISQDGFDRNRVSFRRMSDTQCKRNYNRARKFDKSRKEQNLTSEFIETARNSEEIIHSTPVPVVLDSSQCVPDQCLLESSATHVTTDHSQSRVEPFLDNCDSSISDTPERIGSNTCEIPDSVEITIEPKISKSSPYKSRVYDSERFDSPLEAAKEPCDKKNCSFGPTPDKVDPAAVWSDNDKNKHDYIIKKCPHCHLQVCMLCMKCRGRHKKYFVKPPPWD